MRSSITIRTRVVGAGIGSARSSAGRAAGSAATTGASCRRFSVVWSEHRTHQLRWWHCRARTSARLPEQINGSPFGPRLQAAMVTLTAAYRVSRRGIVELARDLFGVSL